ncbi:hypothetical protein U1Q18_038743 [Sarracenia purpurea var. burkii]
MKRKRCFGGNFQFLPQKLFKLLPWDLFCGGNRLGKDKLKPVKGLYKLKKWVEDRGLKQAAITNAPRENAELMKRAAVISHLFRYYPDFELVVWVLFFLKSKPLGIRDKHMLTN